MRGYGESDFPLAADSYRFEHLVTDIKDIVEYLGELLTHASPSAQPRDSERGAAGRTRTLAGSDGPMPPAHTHQRPLTVSWPESSSADSYWFGAWVTQSFSLTPVDVCASGLKLLLQP